MIANVTSHFVFTASLYVKDRTPQTPRMFALFKWGRAASTKVEIPKATATAMTASRTDGSTVPATKLETSTRATVDAHRKPTGVRDRIWHTLCRSEFDGHPLTL